MTHAKPPLLVFADDWGRHPSSCQHLVGHLLGRNQVWWVNTIGTRRPRLDWATLARGMEKVRHWSSRPHAQGRDEGRQPANPDLHVLNPRMWPSFGSRLERRINRELLVRQLTPVLAAMPEPPIAVTTIPLVADLIGCLRVRRWVYYCVDDFTQWPGLDGKTLSAMEDRLIQRSDVIVAVSATLREKVRRLGRSAHLLTHGVDLGHWDPSVNAAARSSASEFDGLQRPLCVFWGLVDRRLDVTFIARLATDLTSGTIVLVGPESDPDPALASLPRVVRHTAVPFEQLPAIAQAAQVLIMPYADLPVTQAMQPLKLKEYLATGKPVIVRDLPAARAWADALDLADSPEGFSRAVRSRLSDGLPEPQRQARARLNDESWADKARDFERWLADGDVTVHPNAKARPVDSHEHLFEACT